MEQIQILGPYNTGTNLIKKLLRNNVINNKNISLGVYEEMRSGAARGALKASPQDTIIKHVVSKIKLNKIISSRQDVLFICMYRPLKNWILSIKKTKYQIHWDYKIDSNVDLYGAKFKNIVDLYNHYYNSYIDLINKYTNVIYLEYNKLIIKENLLDYLNQKITKYSIRIKSEEHLFKILEEPSKGHGQPVFSYIDALNKYKQECNYKIEDEDKYYELLDSKIPKFFEN